MHALDVFYGDSSPALARVYARMDHWDHPQGTQLAGHVRGPFCHGAQTLPVTTPLRDLGSAEQSARGRLACATLTDPCFWSPEVPSLYEVRVEIRSAGKTIDSEVRWLGIRHFGQKGRSLYLEGRRWVVRGASCSIVGERNLGRWRDLGAAMLVEDFDEQLFGEASRQGVMLIVHIASALEQLADRLRFLSRWAAVTMALLKAEAGSPAPLRRAAPNLLLAQYVTHSAPITPQPWAHLIARDMIDPADFAQNMQAISLPVVALGRRSSPFSDLRSARAACDQLQRELAPYMDAAGYLVV